VLQTPCFTSLPTKQGWTSISGVSSGYRFFYFLPRQEVNKQGFQGGSKAFQIDRNSYKSLNINTRAVSWLRMKMRLLTQLRETVRETLPQKYPTHSTADRHLGCLQIFGHLNQDLTFFKTFLF
jgi:hypothetical protein